MNFLFTNSVYLYTHVCVGCNEDVAASWWGFAADDCHSFTVTCCSTEIPHGNVVWRTAGRWGCYWCKGLYKIELFFILYYWIEKDQLDVTCFFVSLFNAQHVSDVNTSILGSLQLICWVMSWVVLLWYDVCWCYVVVWLGWYGIVCMLKQYIVEHCWALNNEIKKQVTSSWHLLTSAPFIQSSTIFNLRRSFQGIHQDACQYFHGEQFLVFCLSPLRSTPYWLRNT